MYCGFCGKEVVGGSIKCNSCGHPTRNNEDLTRYRDNGAKTYAIMGFIYSTIISTIGLVLSIVAYVKYRKQNNQHLKGLAISGIVISAVFLFIRIMSIITIAYNLVRLQQVISSAFAGLV